MRPANIVTAIADVLAGISISGVLLSGTTFADDELLPIILLCLSTVGLYGGGVVFNDVFDAELDRAERPERPIPSGLVSLSEATWLGSVLLLAGVIIACLVNGLSGGIALLIALAALSYNKFSKHHIVAGPLNMGLCRGLNLLLGISIWPDAVQGYGYLIVVPIIYIAAVTTISRGEVHGSNHTPLYISAALYILVISAVLAFAATQNAILYVVPFLAILIWMIGRPLITAIRHPIGSNIGKAVKAGVIALILLNAAWAAATGALYMALLIVILLPLSIALSRVFAVT